MSKKYELELTEDEFHNIYGIMMAEDGTIIDTYDTIASIAKQNNLNPKAHIWAVTEGTNHWGVYAVPELSESTLGFCLTNAPHNGSSIRGTILSEGRHRGTESA